MPRELKITPIKNGTVIDHITDGLALEVLRIIGVKEVDKDSTVSIALHVRSGKIGWKDIVKVENMELSPRKLNAIALVTPTATIVIIRDYQVREKRAVDLPEQVQGIVRCPNPTCVSNQGEPVESSFRVVKRRPLLLKCQYCDRPLSDVLRHLT